MSTVVFETFFKKIPSSKSQVPKDLLTRLLDLFGTWNLEFGI
jgi:hypothetical protein